MKQNNQIFQKLIARILLVSLLLQSCNNSLTSVHPRMGVATHSRQESTTFNLPNQLTAQELAASEGHVVSLHEHEKEGQLLADVEVNASVGFSKTYRDFPVYVHEQLDLAQVLMLSKQQQRQLVEVKLPSSDKKGYVYVGPRGLLGGMKKGEVSKGDGRDEKQRDKKEGEKEKEKEKEGEREKEAEKEQEHDESLEELLSYAQNGNREAQFSLGIKYYQAWKEQQQEENGYEARKWLEKAAIQGHEGARLLLEEVNQSFLPENKHLLEAFNEQAQYLASSQIEGEDSISEKGSLASSQGGLPNYPYASNNVWNTSSLPNLPADPSPERLANDILATTGAEADVRLNVYYQLEKALQEELKKDGGLRGEWNGLWHFLKEPELIVDEDAYTHRKSAINKVLAKQVFHAFSTVKSQIVTFKKALLQRFPEHPEWGNSLEEVARFYDNYRRQVCTVWQDAEQFHAIIEPKALLMGEWWPHTFYRISQRQARYLVGRNRQGQQIKQPGKEESTSNHHVSFLPPVDPSQATVYFKTNGMPALNPSREFMLYSLYKNLDIQVPASGLLILDHIKFGENYHPDPFILQASQAVTGSTGKKVLKAGQKLSLDPEHYAKQVIGALLTGPVDGKADNFIVTALREEQTSHRWVGIDNDEVFQAPIQEGELRFKSILLLLAELVQPLHTGVRLMMSCLHPTLLILEWLVDLQLQETKYEAFKHTTIAHGTNTRYIRKGGSLTAEQIAELWHGEKELKLPFKDFFTSIIPTVSYLIQKMQMYLKENRGLSLAELFACCYPRVSAYYQALQEQAKHQPYEALRQLYGSTNKKVPVLLQLGASQGPGEENYFKEDKPIGAALITKTPTSETSMSERISAYLSQASNLNMDAVTQAYASWLHQDKDQGTQQLIIQKALKSLHILIHYKFKQVQDVATAITLYVKGLALLSADQQPVWEAVFDKLGEANADLAWQLVLERNFPRGWDHNDTIPHTLAEIRGARLGKRYLTAQMQQVLFNSVGDFQGDTTLTGRSLSNFYPTKNPLFYFKKYPELPAYEYAATSFMRHLGLKDAPRSELLVFYNKKEGFYPVLLTQAVVGDPVYKVWDEDSHFAQLDPYPTGLLILASILLNPEDSKEDNFILTPDKKQLIPIDNDHVFLPGAIEVKGKLGFTIYPQLQTKTLAFCLPAMYQPFDEKLVQHLSSLNVDIFLQRWMNELIQINDLYQHTLPEEQLLKLWQEHGSALRLPLTSLYIQNLYKKFHLLRTMLVQNRYLRPIELVSRLEPYVGRFYEEVASLPTLQARFKEVSKIYKQGPVSGSRRSVANSKQLKESRMSIADSWRLMEIMQVSNGELTASVTQCKQSPTAALEQIKQLQKDKGVQEDRVQELIRGTLADSNIERVALPDEAILIRQWFESEESYDWIILPYSEQLQPRHLISFQFQNKGTLLRALDLRGAKQLGEWDFMALYRHCPNLQYLNISEWKIKRLGYFQEGGLFGTSLLLGQEPIFPCLERLVANNCQGLQEICLHLAHVQSLEALGNTRLSKFWLKAPDLKLLDLSGNSIKEEGNFYLDTNPDISSMLKGIAPQEAWITEQFIKGQKDTLNLAKKWIGHRDFLFLIKHPYFRDQVQTLDLSSNNIGASGAEELAKALANCQLQTLNLSWNNIGASGAQELAKALANCQLQTLYLSNNNIGALGAQEIAKALATNCQLQTLDLSDNNIGAAMQKKLVSQFPKIKFHF